MKKNNMVFTKACQVIISSFLFVFCLSFSVVYGVENSDSESKYQNLSYMLDYMDKDTHQISHLYTNISLDLSGRENDVYRANCENHGTGWQVYQNDWYYQKDNGYLARNEWLEIDGVKYHFDADGRLQHGWFYDVDGEIYFLDISGNKQNKVFGITCIDGYYYGFDTLGRLAKEADFGNGFTTDIYGLIYLNGIVQVSLEANLAKPGVY